MLLNTLQCTGRPPHHRTNQPVHRANRTKVDKPRSNRSRPQGSLRPTVPSEQARVTECPPVTSSVATQHSILPPPLAIYVTLTKLFNLSETQFPHLKSGDAPLLAGWMG